MLLTVGLTQPTLLTVGLTQANTHAAKLSIVELTQAAQPNC